LELFNKVALILYFGGDIGDFGYIVIERGLIDFFPSHLLDGGAKEEQFQLIHHHEFGDLKHNLVQGHIKYTGFLLSIFTQLPDQGVGVVGEFGGYVLFVGLVVALLDVGLGWTMGVGFGADAHWGNG
jgi:hypothetical protein